MTAKAPEAPAAQVKAGRIAVEALREVVGLVKPGVSGAELDRAAEQAIRDRGGVPAFKGYRGYGATLCLSINEQVVHGIPGERTLADGDLASLDLGVKLDGYYVDTAVTVSVGTSRPEAERLRQATEAALGIALRQARAGNTTGDLGAAVESYVTEQGFAVVRDCVGHGIGKGLHEDPSVPNYGKKGKGSRFSAGQVVAIEPMVVAGSPQLKLAEDQWTLSTEDDSLASHAEETVLITDGDPVRITPVTDSLGDPGTLSGEKADARVTKATQNTGSR
ncbi:MAG: type I methionyl aminopeptidase [bacterium]|nr:type I methionyl aminopeptidase [bacterium]MDZ4247783.1 type I methionyl aminopeptidase [Patescibacteria group bacterium]